MNRLFTSLASIVLVGGLVFALVECSGAECGNGVKEGSEQCDNGSMNGAMGNGCSKTCMLVSIPRAMVELDVSFLVDEGPGYSAGANAMDLGIGSIQVMLSGPDTKNEMWKPSMQSNQWVGVTPGTYSATVTLLDSNMTALTNPVTSTSGMVASPGSLNLKVNFKQSDFKKQDYKGPLYVSPNWGATNVSCTDAMPVVSQESIRVTDPSGAFVAGMTVVGNPPMNEHNLDGTYGPCFYKNGLNLFEKVDNLTWGHYKVTIEGKDASGTVAYCTTAPDLFVGPGVSNPTYEVVVTAANADAGACP
jgi:cysteine-rich repeat protein